MRPRELVSKVQRAVQRVPQKPKLRHPFEVYYDPDYVPQVDGVKVETLTPEQIDRRARHLSEAQVEGVRVLAALNEQRQSKRRSR